ncbi:MAG: LarC family nickel insertion protein, partial [Candidatus Sumerlaeota bacterium]|nr:LarC family nickel insertion protein [Candidatus Sumerlaeota bacterium]
MDLFFDCSSGISGDMTLGALVDLGADLDGIIQDLNKLPVTGFRLARHSVMQCGIQATRVGVEINAEDDDHRSLSEVRDILLAAKLPARAEKRALAAFEKLAVAEAKVHGTTIEKIHFHEVGALDAIVDVAGSMLALEQLDAARIISSALNVGHGTIRCHHGVFPVPAPATAELLKGMPSYQDELSGELVTPTGAAILATVAESFGLMPSFTIEKIGYGAGTREHAVKRPNFLRVCGGRLADAPSRFDAALQGLEHEKLCQISAEMDDESGETF